MRAHFATALLLILLAGLLAVSCSDSDETENPFDILTAHSNADDMETLALAVGLHMEAYAFLLNAFSENGAKPLFDPSVDLGQPGEAAFDEMEDELFRITDKIVAFDPELTAALQSLDAKIEWARANGKFKVLDDMQPQPPYRKVRLADWINPISAWAAKQREDKRKTITDIIDKGDAQLQEGLYNLAKDMQSAGRLDLDASQSTDLGGSAAEFIAKLKSGELDNKLALHKLHSTASNDPITTEGYADIAHDLNKRPTDNFITQGIGGLKAGLNTAIDAGKKVVAAGLQVGGKAFEKGWDLAESAIEKVKDAEKLVTKPLDFVKGKIKDAFTSRVKQFVATKTGLDEDSIGKLADGVAEEVQGVVQQVEAGKAAETGDAATTAMGEAWGLGGVSLSNAAQSIGSLITWEDAKGVINTMLCPGGYSNGDTVLIDGNVAASVIALGEDKKIAKAVDDVDVPENEVVDVELPDLIDPADYEQDDDANDGCGPDGWRCPGGDCISIEQVCDGLPDCWEWDDELDCYNNTVEPACADDEYPCDDGLVCLTSDQFCDGIYDCELGDDEEGCQYIR